MTPDDTFDDVLAANEAFAERFQHNDLKARAAKGLGVLTCIDSRIDPLAMLGLVPGDAKILRNAGARVTDDVLRTLVLGSYLLGVERVMVVAHTNCRMADSTQDDVHEAIRDAGGPDTRSITFLTTVDQEAALETDVQRVRSWPYLGNIAVGGFLYDLVDRPAPPRLLTDATTRRGGWHVLVAPEDVLRVVGRLHRGQPVPGGAGVRGADPLRTLVGEEVDVGAVVALVQGGRDLVHPGRARLAVGRTVVEGRDVHHDAGVAVGVRRGVGRHPGYRAAEHPELGDPHRRVAGLQELDDGGGLVTADRVDEHRPGHRGRVVVGVLGRIDLAGRASARTRLASGSARARNGAIASSPAAVVTSPADQREDDEAAVLLLGDEWQRWAAHDVRRSWSARPAPPRLAAMKPATVSAVAGRRSMPPTTWSDLVQPELEPGGDAVVAPAPADGPEQVRVRLLVDAEHLAVSGHDVGGEQAVDGEAVLAGEVADAAAEGDPTEPH